MAASRGFLAFLMTVPFFSSLAIILFELALTRVFSIILWYDYAYMAIPIAFFGLGVGSLLIHMQKDYGEQRGVVPMQARRYSAEPLRCKICTVGAKKIIK